MFYCRKNLNLWKDSDFFDFEEEVFAELFKLLWIRLFLGTLLLCQKLG